MDCLNADEVFYFDSEGKKPFNFKLFYQEIRTLGLKENEQIVLEKLKNEGIEVTL